MKKRFSMKKSLPVVVVDRAIPFLTDFLRGRAEVVALPADAMDAATVKDADALVVRTRTRCDEALLAGSRVRLVMTATIGHDHIDRAWCAEQGIRVETAAGCNARGVLQWVAAVLADAARSAGWHPSQRTLGVVGVGHVGSLVKAYAEAWGFRVLGCDPPREEREQLGFLTLEAVAAEADILTFHTPLDAATRHLCDAALLQQMKPSALILNSSRGEVVDGRAVLASGHPYCFDVWEGEPCLDGEVLRNARLATPHVAGYSAQGKANASMMAARVLSDHFGWPWEEWYPTEVIPPKPRMLTWEELLATIDGYYDIVTESALLKQHPERFEAFRDAYRVRLEYF